MAKQAVDLEPDASSQHLHNGRDNPLPPANLHGTDVNHRPLPTDGEAQNATAIQCQTGSGYKTIHLGTRDMVFITIGSIVEDTAYGDGDTVPELTANKEGPAVGASWQLWENPAHKSTAFGRPGTFSRNVPASTWESATLTCKASPLMGKLKELSVNDPSSGNTVTGGVITFTDSAWLMSFTVNRQPHFPEQPKDVVVTWV